MTNIADIETIRLRFLNLWDEDVAVIFDNAGSIKEPTTWVRLSVQPGDERAKAFGRVYEQRGRVWVKVMVPTQTGIEEGTRLIGKIASIYREWSSPTGAIRFGTPEFGNADTDGDDYVFMMSIPYRAEHRA